MPGGLFPDQAANGEDALAILRGDVQPFYERGNGREALFFYLQAALISAFGVGVWPMFVASALVGLATVWMTFTAGKRLFGEEAGLLAGFFIAVSQWHISLSRTGFRAIMVPLFIALSLYFAAGILQKSKLREKIWQGIGLGVSFGLGWYTYIAFRAILGLIVVALLMYLFYCAFRKFKQTGFRLNVPAFVVATITFLIVFLPIGIYFYTHPGSFMGRSGQVSVFNPDLNGGDVTGTVLNIFVKSVLGFFTAGDVNPRHNVSGYPFLSFFPASFLIIGLAVSVRRSLRFTSRLFRGVNTAGESVYPLLLVLTAIMLAPAVATAEGIPHGLRSIGEIPAVFLLAGIGAAWVLKKIEIATTFSNEKFYTGIFKTILVFTAVYELFLYFGVSGSSEKYWREYRTDLTEVSEYINGRSKLSSGKTYLALDDFSVQTVHFLTTNYNYPYILVRPERSEEVKLETNDVIIFTQSTMPDAFRYDMTHPEAKEIMRVKNRFGESTMVVMAIK